MSKYSKDKERMDEITERLSQRQDIWQDRYIYWIAVTLGHILEWMVKQMKPGDINEDGKEIEQDMNITWEEFNETLPDTQKILSVFPQGTKQSRGDSE